MNLSKKLLIAALLLIGAASVASAQTYWTYGDYDPKARGYYGTPYDGAVWISACNPCDWLLAAAGHA